MKFAAVVALSEHETHIQISGNKRTLLVLAVCKSGASWADSQQKEKLMVKVGGSNSVQKEGQQSIKGTATDAQGHCTRPKRLSTTTETAYTHKEA